MATVRYVGNARLVSQVDTYTVGGTPASGAYTLTRNGKSVTYTAVVGGDTNTTIATALYTALAANTTDPEFTEVTWTNPSAGVIKATAVTAGVAIPTFSHSQPGGATITPANVTPNSGPSDVSVGANWSGGAVPSAADDIWLQFINVPLLYNLGTMSGIKPASLHIDQTFTATQIGLPDTNSSGSVAYAEDRQKYLQFAGVDAVYVGQGGTPNSGGCGFMRLDFGSVNTTIQVDNTGPAAVSGLPALQIIGTGASNSLNLTKGSVGVAVGASQTATLLTANVSYQTQRNSDSYLQLGPGVTMGTITQDAGVVKAACNVTTWTKTGGDSYSTGTGTITTITNDAPKGEPKSTHYWYSSGTITTGKWRGPGAVLDCTADLRSRTLTNGTFTYGGHFLDPAKTITFTSAWATDSESAGLGNYGDAPFNLQRS